METPKESAAGFFTRKRRLPPAIPITLAVLGLLICALFFLPLYKTQCYINPYNGIGVWQTTYFSLIPVREERPYASLRQTLEETGTLEERNIYFDSGSFTVHYLLGKGRACGLSVPSEFLNNLLTLALENGYPDVSDEGRKHIREMREHLVAKYANRALQAQRNAKGAVTGFSPASLPPPPTPSQSQR